MVRRENSLRALLTFLTRVYLRTGFLANVDADLQLCKVSCNPVLDVNN